MTKLASVLLLAAAIGSWDSLEGRYVTDRVAIIAETDRRSPDDKNILVLAVEFRDKPASMEIERLNALMNYDTWDPATGRGGFKDFFIENSYGQFAPQSHVYGWFEAEHSFAFYTDTLDEASAAARLVTEALRQAESIGVDLSSFDKYVDLRAETVVLVTSSQITAHFGYLMPPVVIQDVTFRSYTIQWPDLGTLVHEFGHALGLKDLYKAPHTFGNFDVMARSGSMRSTPGHFSAFSKYVLGWIEPEVIDKPVRGLKIPNSHDQPFALLIRGRDGTKWSYFIVENRIKKGYDAGRNGTVPNSGLVIYHSGERNMELPHIEQADGRLDLEEFASSEGLGGNRGDAGDLFPGTSGNTKFDEHSNPSSRTETGLSTGISITNISLPGDTMTIDVEFAAETGIRSFTLTSTDVILHPNYPNPFSSMTTIEYEIPVASHVEVDIFDMTGRVVATLENGMKRAGSHRAILTADSLPAGHYVCRLHVDDREFVRTLILVK